MRHRSCWVAFSESTAACAACSALRSAAAFWRTKLGIGKLALFRELSLRRSGLRKIDCDPGFYARVEGEGFFELHFDAGSVD